MGQGYQGRLDWVGDGRQLIPRELDKDSMCCPGAGENGLGKVDVEETVVVDAPRVATEDPRERYRQRMRFPMH